MKAKKENWLLTLCIVQSVALALVMGCYLYLKSTEIETYACIKTLPVKTTYVAGMDTVLDLTGATITEATSPQPRRGDEVYDVVSNLGTHFTIVSEDIDFSTPGIYEVRIRGFETECAFPIEVIDPARLQ